LEKVIIDELADFRFFAQGSRAKNSLRLFRIYGYALMSLDFAENQGLCLHRPNV
jgi:hypothetical protein